LIANNPCGTVNPASGTISIGDDTYYAGVWYTFNITDYANVEFITTNSYFGKRLYAGNVEESCSLTLLREQKSLSMGFIYPCLPAGTYSFQILGKMDTLNLITGDLITIIWETLQI
jgi:hypothetical protein